MRQIHNFNGTLVTLFLYIYAKMILLMPLRYVVIAFLLFVR